MALNHRTGPFHDPYLCHESLVDMAAWNQDIARDWHASAVADMACGELQEATMSQNRAAYYSHRARHGMGLRPEDYDHA